MLELLGILSMLVVIGAITSIGFRFITTSVEFGDGSLMSWSKALGPLSIAAIALSINLAASRMRKRLDR